jgi:hypothetical protein
MGIAIMGMVIMGTATTDAAITAVTETGTMGADGIAVTEEAIGEAAVFTGTANLFQGTANQ